LFFVPVLFPGHLLYRRDFLLMRPRREGMASAATVWSAPPVKFI
jgi:hypothetical protein